MKVYIEPKALMFLLGTTMDFVGAAAKCMGSGGSGAVCVC